VIDFTDRLAVVAVILEMLRNGNDIRNFFAEMSGQIAHAGCIGPKTCQQARTRWGAQRLLAIRSFEEQPLFGQLIDIGRDDLLVTISMEFRPKIIDGDKQNIHLTVGRIMNEFIRKYRRQFTPPKFNYIICSFSVT
jgi:hypothetical protein